MRHRRMLRPWVGLVLAGLVVSLVTAAAGLQAAATATETSRFSKADRAALMERVAAGEREVTLLIAASSSSVADSVRGLGGTIDHRDDRAGYLRVSVPIGAADNVSRLAGIAAIDVDRTIPIMDPKPEGGNANVDPPDENTPPLNAYMPTQDTGAPQFVAANPRFDGRGVTIGIVDTGIDILAPELQTASKDDGKSIPKIKDWVNFNHPVDDDDPTWLDMTTQVKARNGQFTVGTVTYTGPKGMRGANFRFGTLNENSLAFSEYSSCGSAARADLDRDDFCGEVFAVIWDGDEKVWVDSNGDRSFADSKAMEQFSKKRDMGVFGTDNPATDVRESVPFVVQADEKLLRVNIGIVSQSHGTHVAGIAAGKNYFGGRFDGAAPEAQIVSVNVCILDDGCSFHGLIEGMIYAVADAKSDVVNMSIGGLPALNDGNGVFAETYKRLMKDHNVQLVMSAGNEGPGYNSQGDPSDTDGVISVGSYINKASWLAQYGATTQLDSRASIRSRRAGRSRTAASSRTSSLRARRSRRSRPGWTPRASASPYDCPAGYALFNGTSMASPQTAGAIALLLSAAKPSGVESRSRGSSVSRSRRTSRFIGTRAGERAGSGPHQRRCGVDPPEDEEAQGGRDHEHAPR